MKISAKIEKLIAKIDKLQGEITTLRDECPHPTVYVTAKSNSGNYDPSADSYWYEFKCKECNKQWNEDQDVYIARQRAEGWKWERERTIIKTY